MAYVRNKYFEKGNNKTNIHLFCFTSTVTLKIKKIIVNFGFRRQIIKLELHQTTMGYLLGQKFCITLIESTTRLFYVRILHS